MMPGGQGWASFRMHGGGAVRRSRYGSAVCRHVLMPVPLRLCRLQVFLNKEALVRSLYRGEVLWLVYVVQARALGRKVRGPEGLGRGGEGRRDKP